MKLSIRMGILFLFAISWVEGGSVRLANDSPFTLKATIRASDSSYLGEMVIPSQRTLAWDDYWGTLNNSSLSKTPYIITWYCVDGADFSVCDNVATGAIVLAMSCDGSRACKVKKRKTPKELEGDQVERNLQQQQQKNVGPPQGIVD